MGVRPDQSETVYDRTRFRRPHPVGDEHGVDAALLGFTFGRRRSPGSAALPHQKPAPGEGVAILGGQSGAERLLQASI